MPRRDDERPEETATPTLSPEFLTGEAAGGLEKLRARLLDLTNRNRLLNFRHTAASSIRVVDANLDIVFSRLIGQEEVPFEPVPEPDAASYGRPPELFDQDSRHSKPAAAERAEALGWQVSHDLNAPSRCNPDSQCLPVLHYPEDLETLTRKIGSAANTVIEESGTNMLYVTFGFLEWYESDDSNLPRLAPLLTVPVTLNRKRSKGKGFEAAVEYSGEDCTTNLSLVEKMRRDFAIEIPSIDEDDTPESYFARFEPVLDQKRRWKIRRQLTLSLLSFGKLLMYRDLDAKVWPEITTHALVRELFEGRRHQSIAHAPEHSIDAPEMKHEVPPLVVDADSSQHSALIDALRGQNLVIEGPPGTGKSQTITNLIAAALTAGKSVLFVSEKLAALEVVRRRLDAVGLGLFCLELHNHKTRKDSLLRELEARLKARGSFRDPRELDQHLAMVEEKKRLLTRYVSLINREMHPFGATVFDILWARDRSLQELTFDRGAVENLMLPSALEYSRTELMQAEQFLAVHAQQLSAVLRAAPALFEHPWAWVEVPLSLLNQERVCDLLEGCIARAQESGGVRELIADATCVSLADNIPALLGAEELLSALPESKNNLPVHLLAPSREACVREAILRFVETARDASQAQRALEEATSNEDPTPFLKEGIDEQLARAVAALTTLGLSECGLAELHQRLSRGRHAEGALAEAEGSFAALTSLVGCNVPFDTRHVDLLLTCLEFLRSAPLDLLHLRTPRLEKEGAARTVANAAARAQDLQRQEERLGEVFDLSRVEPGDIARLREHATRLEQAGVFERLFGRQYRAARGVYRRIARDGGRTARTDWVRNLRTLADHRRACARFESDSVYRDLWGAQFAGLETNWEDMRRLVRWYEETLLLLPESDIKATLFREILLRGRAEQLKAISAALRAHDSHRNRLEHLRTIVADSASALGAAEATGLPICEVRERLRAANAQLDEAIRILTRADLRPDVPPSAVGELRRAADRYRANMAELDSRHDVRGLLGNAFQGVGTDLQPIETAVRFAETVVKSSLPPGVTEWLLCEDYAARSMRLRDWLGQALGLGRELSRIRDAVRAVASPNWHADENESLQTVSDRAARALGRREDLSQWSHFQRSRAEAVQRGLGKLTALVEEARLQPAHLVPAFQFAFYPRWTPKSHH